MTELVKSGIHYQARNSSHLKDIEMLYMQLVTIIPLGEYTVNSIKVVFPKA